MKIELSKEDWMNILDALNLAEDDRVEQANCAMGDEDKRDCMEAAMAYANIATEIQKQMENGGKKENG